MPVIYCSALFDSFNVPLYDLRINLSLSDDLQGKPLDWPHQILTKFQTFIRFYWFVLVSEKRENCWVQYSSVGTFVKKLYHGYRILLWDLAKILCGQSKNPLCRREAYLSSNIIWYFLPTPIKTLSIHLHQVFWLAGEADHQTQADINCASGALRPSLSCEAENLWYVLE